MPRSLPSRATRRTVAWSVALGVGAALAAVGACTQNMGVAPGARSTAFAAAPTDTTVPPGPLPLKLTPRPTVAAITARDLMTRSYIFADDSMQGRAAWTPGNVRGTEYIVRELRRLGLQPAGEAGGFYQAVPFTVRRAAATAQTPPVDSAAPPPAPSYNVVAVLPGSDPVLRHQYVALGAHNDHVGVRPSGVDHDSLKAFNAEARRLYLALDVEGDEALTPAQNEEYQRRRAEIRVNLDSLRRVRPARLDTVNNGADDDGSGSVALLEIAEELAARPVKPKRSVLFVWHTAEERGLVGARWWVDHPTVPRDSVVAQLNIDMIGRGASAQDQRNGGPGFVGVIGARRLSTELGDLLDAVNAAQPRPLRLDGALDADGHPQNIYCRSDHYHYARYGIPIAFFFTGLHGDYHQPTDEPQYLNYPNFARVTALVRDMAVRVADLDRRVAVDKPKPDPNGSCRQ